MLRAGDEVSTFLDIRDRVRDRGEEEGLLGLAFDPDFESNGYLFVYYTADGPRRSVISRFSVPRGDGTADPGTETLVWKSSNLIPTTMADR